MFWIVCYVAIVTGITSFDKMVSQKPSQLTSVDVTLAEQCHNATPAAVKAGKTCSWLLQLRAFMGA